MRLLLVFCVIASISACVKAPSYPIVPAIEFKSVSSSMVLSGQVDTITISFTDGDGDISISQNAGEDSCELCDFKNGDSTCLRLRLRDKNIFLIDSRDSCLVTLASPYVEPEGTYKAISGEIQIITAIDSKKCFVVPDPNCPIDSVKYTIILRDRAGHFSNATVTTAILVDGR